MTRDETIQLLTLFGDDVTEAVLSELDSEQAQTLREHVQAQKKKPISTRRQQSLLGEFDRFFRFALKTGGLRPRLHDGVESTGETTPPPPPSESTGHPLKDLCRLSVHQVAGALETEQPRTVSILLAQLPPDFSAEVLSRLPDEDRDRVIREMSHDQEVPKPLLDRIARTIFQRGKLLPVQAVERRDHVERLADVLRAVPKNRRKPMLAAIAEEDEPLSTLLLKKLYRFEDLVALPSREIQQILGEVDGGTLTTALFQADAELVEAVLGNLSKRARQSIEDEMQFQTHVPEARVLQAREAVSEVMAKIDQAGE